MGEKREARGSKGLLSLGELKPGINDNIQMLTFFSWNAFVGSLESRPQEWVMLYLATGWVPP